MMYRCRSGRESYRVIFVMRDKLILFSVKREFSKLFFGTRSPVTGRF